MQIEKTGTLDCDIVEANPIVFAGTLYRFEYIRYRSADKRYHGNTTGTSYFRLVNVATGEILPPFGANLHMGNAFATADCVIVTAVEDWGAPRFYQLESKDLRNWSTPRVIIENPQYAGYNTSVCQVDAGRFVMAFELGAPADKVGVPFTMFFAESHDLAHWREIPGACFGKEIYTGAPLLRFFAGWFYFFYLGGSYESGFVTRVARSRDLVNWQHSPDVVLGYDEHDRQIAPGARLNAGQRAKIADAININASDLDMCAFNGRLYCVYSWGNQRGTEFLATGTVNASEQEFCESFFKHGN